MSFAKLVEKTMKAKWPDLDIPLGEEYYNINSLDLFDKENKTLYETLAMDRLCTMMARQYYLNLNKKLAQKAQKIDWKKEDGGEVIVFTFQSPNQPALSYSIRFSLWDFTKLYVTDDSEFLARLCYYFFTGEKEIEYHKLYSEGINKYTNLQKEGIESILDLEKKLIERKQIKPMKNYLSFNEIMNKSGYNKDEQGDLKQVRNSLLHYNLNFEKEHLKKFYEVMRRERIEKKWSLIV